MLQAKPHIVVALLSIVLWQSMAETCCAQKATLRILNDVAARFETAYKAFEQDEFEIAAGIFAEIANLESETTFENDRALSIEARYWLAESQMNSRKYRQARKNYRRYLSASPTGQYVAWASLRMGQTAKRLGEFVAAEKAFATFLRRFPGHDQTATAYQELPDVLYRIALADFKAWKDYGDREGIDSAYKRLATHQRVFPQDKNRNQVCYYLGQVFREKKNFEEAKAAFSECVVAISENETASRDQDLLPLAHYYLAEASKQLGESAAAEKHFQLVVDGWPAGAAAKFAALQLTEIRTISNQERSRPPKKTELQVSREPTQLTSTATKNESLETEAQTTVNQPIASQNAAEKINRYIQSAVSQYEKSDFDRAIESLNRAVKAFPASNREHEVHDLLAQCYYAKSDYQSARNHWQRVVRSTHAVPNLAANALVSIAQSYRDQGNYHAAIREYLRLASIFESDERYRQSAFDAAAFCYEQIGDHRSASGILIAANAERAEKSPSDLTAQRTRRSPR